MKDLKGFPSNVNFNDFIDAATFFDTIKSYKIELIDAGKHQIWFLSKLSEKKMQIFMTCGTTSLDFIKIILEWCGMIDMTCTIQKVKFSMTDFLSKCDQIRSFLQIWLHLLQKSVMENFILCPVLTLGRKIKILPLNECLINYQ